MIARGSIVPKGWKRIRVAHCFDIQQGKQVSKKNRIGENQCPFLRTANVFWGRIDLNNLDHMNFAPIEEEKFRLQPEDLLVCEGGDIGRTAMWENGPDNCYYQNHLHRLRKINDEVAPKFILFWLQYSFVYSKVYLGCANITTIPNLSKSRLAEFELILPPLSEQKAIAHILTTVQEAIAGQEAMINKLQELKKSMMHHLFMHGTKGEKTKMTEIGEMPESWEVVELGKICDILSSSRTFKQAEIKIGPVKVHGIKVSDMNMKGNEKRIYSTGISFNFSNTEKLIPPGAIIFPKRGAAIATNKKRITLQYSLLDPNLIAVSVKSMILPNFLYYFFERFDLRTLTDCGTIPQLNKKSLIPILFKCPEYPTAFQAWG